MAARQCNALVCGSGGLLGSALLQQAARLDDIAAIGVTHAQVDIADAAAVSGILDNVRPDVVVNAAAYTNVDGAQTAPAAAMRANATGPAVLAAETARRGLALVQISTDHVFDGQAGRALEPEEPTGPVSVYGLTKLGGEQAVLALSQRAWVVRTSGLFGAGGRNFVDAVAARMRRGEPLRVVADQVCSRTYSVDLAAAIWELVTEMPPWGIYHFCNEGGSSWYEFAQAVQSAVGTKVPIEPVTSAVYGAPAPRPAWSVLSVARWVGVGLRAPRDETEALAAYVATWPPATA